MFNFSKRIEWRKTWSCTSMHLIAAKIIALTCDRVLVLNALQMEDVHILVKTKHLVHQKCMSGSLFVYYTTF